MVQLGIFKFSALFYFSALLILPRNTQVTCYVSTTVNRLHKYIKKTHNAHYVPFALNGAARLFNFTLKDPSPAS